MNTKLAESLAEAVVALPKEDYDLFQEAITDRLICKTQGVAGGYACVRNTRIAVWTLISLKNQGATDVDLLEDFPGLTRFDLITVESYYQRNKLEVDAVIADHQREETGDGWVLCE